MFRISLRTLLLNVLPFSLVLITASPIPCQEPVPGLNVNLVSGTKWPGGDPFAQRQNEPSGAASTMNKLHLLAASNDYSTVDINDVLGNNEIGDAWLGIFKSFDGGMTWRKSVLAGCPYNITECADEKALPLRGFHAAADPTVRSNINGLFHLSGIVFNRGTNAPGALFVATFHDANNKENDDSIRLQWVTLVDTGNSGQFLDKPWIEVDKPRGGKGTCFVPGYNGGASFSIGNVYLVYSKFVGSDVNNPHSQVMFSRSSDGAKTWSAPIKLSESHSINQGTTLAIDPGSGDIYVVWRRIQNPSANESNAIMFARSTNGGGSFTKAAVAAEIDPFDQVTSPTTFRTRAFPTIAVYKPTSAPTDPSVIYLAWSERVKKPADQGPYGEARIVVQTSTNGGRSWNLAETVDSPQQDINMKSSSGWTTDGGNQFMPSLSVAADKVMLLFYDHREDHTAGVYTPIEVEDPTAPGGKRKTGLYAETRELASALKGTPEPDTPEKVFGSLSDKDLARRHTLDVRVAQAQHVFQAPLNQNPPIKLFGPSVRVSLYKFGTRPIKNTEKIESERIEQLQFNPPNFPMFNAGLWPFIGDYIDLVPDERFVRVWSADRWTWDFNLPWTATGAPVFHAFWTDNRNVRPPSDGHWEKYVPPLAPTGSVADCADETKPCPVIICSTPPCPSFYDPSQTRTQCSPETAKYAGIRNQDVYTSRITQGVVMGSLTNTKRLKSSGGPLQRGHVIFVQNNRNMPATYELTIDPATVASFVQSYSLNKVKVDVAPRSTIARTVFITRPSAGSSYPTVNVTALEVGGTGLKASVVLNADIANADIANADIVNADIANADIVNAEIYNADIVNADIANRSYANANVTNADIANADIVNADIANADIVNADIVNADIANADIANADIVNADIVNADIVNADIANDAIVSKAVTDVTWTIRNAGNAAAAYNIKLWLKELKALGKANLQMFLYKTYTNPVTLTLEGKPDCYIKQQVQNQLVASIPDPKVLTPETSSGLDLNPKEDIEDGNVNNPTIALMPGETGKITLRISGVPDADRWTVLDALRAAATAQGRNTDGSSPTPVALAIKTYQLPDAKVGESYTATVDVSGGTGRKIIWTDISSTTTYGRAPLSPSLSEVFEPIPPSTSPLSAASDGLKGLINGTPIKASIDSQEGEGFFKFRLRADEQPEMPDVDPLKPPPQYDIGVVTLRVAKGTQKITFGAIVDNKTYGDPPFTLSATASSGLPVTFSASGNCAVAGTTVTITGAGSCTITASQSGNSNYTAAPDETRSFTIAQASQTITFGALAGKTYGDPPFTLSASASSGLQVTFSASGNCTVAGSTVTITGAGPCTITASQEGNSNYKPASPVQQSFNITRASQTITFGALADKAYGDAPFTVSASASSGLQVTLSASGNCTVAGSTVTITGAGSCAITASQAGNSNYGPATPVTQSFAIAAKYRFFGFLPPMATYGSVKEPSCSGVANLGSNVTLKWQLKDGSGRYVSDLAAIAYIAAAPNTSASSCPASPSVPQSEWQKLWPEPRGGTELRYSATNNQWILNWSTTGLDSGYYNVIVQLSDGSAPYSTMIQLR